MKTIILPTHLTRRSLLEHVLPFIVLLFVCFAVSPQARATCQEGCDSEDNTFLGDDALVNNTIGFNNTATGFVALYTNTTGADNTATGSAALYTNTTGNFNTASGAFALFYNTTGFDNTASGDGALFNNTTGFNNTATGSEALYANTTGTANTATGVGALQLNTTGNTNTATGFNALFSNTTGSSNTANGQNALRSNTTGSGNIALGHGAGANLTMGDYNIDLGNRGLPGESKTIRIGIQEMHAATYIAGVSGTSVSGTTVVVNSRGQLGVAPSSQRFKQNVHSMGDASKVVLALRPVSFEYKKELDPDSIPQFGLVAEEVEKVNPDLVGHDEQGKPYTVRYEAVNVMLLNEFLKEHRKNEQQEATIKQLKAELQATATRQQKQIEALTAGLQKVSAQFELCRPALQTVVGNH